MIRVYSLCKEIPVEIFLVFDNMINWSCIKFYSAYCFWFSLHPFPYSWKISYLLLQENWLTVSMYQLWVKFTNYLPFLFSRFHYQLEKLASSCCHTNHMMNVLKGFFYPNILGRKFDIHYHVYQLFCRMKMMCLLVIQWQGIQLGRGLIHYFKVILGLFTLPLSVPWGTLFFHPLQTQLVWSYWPFCFLLSLILFFLEIMNISVILLQFDYGAQN